MKNIYSKELIIGVIASIVAAFILWGLEQIITLSFWQKYIILSLVIFSALSFIIWSLYAKLTALNKDSNDKITLHSSNKTNLIEQIKNCEKSFLFLGISSKRTMSTPQLQSKLVEIGRAKGEIKILLLDPNSPNLEIRASDEEDVPEAWKADIQGTIARLKGLAKREGIEINIKLYNQYPVWRMSIIDQKIIYINFFLKGQQGPQSQSLILKNNNDLFNAFILEFEQLWLEANDA